MKHLVSFTGTATAWGCYSVAQAVARDPLASLALIAAIGASLATIASVVHGWNRR